LTTGLVKTGIVPFVADDEDDEDDVESIEVTAAINSSYDLPF